MPDLLDLLNDLRALRSENAEKHKRIRELEGKNQELLLELNCHGQSDECECEKKTTIRCAMHVMRAQCAEISALKDSLKDALRPKGAKPHA
jgi:hypothetical protein